MISVAIFLFKFITFFLSAMNEIISHFLETDICYRDLRSSNLLYGHKSHKERLNHRVITIFEARTIEFHKRGCHSVFKPSSINQAT